MTMKSESCNPKEIWQRGILFRDRLNIGHFVNLPTPTTASSSFLCRV